MIRAGWEHGWIRHGRSRLNLAMRLTTRTHEILSLTGAAKGPARSVAALASIAADVALARRLGRSDRPELAMHWLVDAADLALWTGLSTRPGYSQLTTAMNNGHALAIETGARRGLVWGLAVPAANCLVAGAVQRARHRPHAPSVFAWQAAAALAGAGLARYARRLRATRLAAHEAQLVPELARAELAAQNELAVGLDNVLDEAQRAAVLIQLGVAQPANTAGAWKAELAEQTRRSHRYLVDTLAMWQRGHNRTPVLSDVVDLTIAPELAPVVLTAHAAGVLERRLDELPLRGRVHVVAAPMVDGDRPALERIALLVGEHRLELETGMEPLHLHFDPLPGGFGWLALWLAVSKLRDSVSTPAAMVPSGAAVGLALWAHRTSRGGQPTPRDTAVYAATALTLVSSVVQTRAMPNAHDAYGVPRVPASLGVRGLAFVTSLARDGLSGRARMVAWGGGAAAVAMSWALTPRPRPVREFVAQMSWVAMSGAMAGAFTEGIGRDSADLEAWVAQEDARRLAASAAAGRAKALGAVEAALADGERLYAHHADELDPALRAESRRRLDRCAERLERTRREASSTCIPTV